MRARAQSSGKEFNTGPLNPGLVGERQQGFMDTNAHVGNI